jgi:hypothetical protein
MASFGERFVGAMQLNVKTFEEVEADTTAMGQAVTVVLIGAVASGIGNIFRHGISGLVIGTFVSLIAFALWAALVWAVGTKLMPEPQTKADFAETFRVVGFAAAPGILRVLEIIPFLGPLIGIAISIWILVAMVIAVRQVLDYTNTGMAIVVCVIGFIGYMLTMFFLWLPFITLGLIFR